MKKSAPAPQRVTAVVIEESRKYECRACGCQLRGRCWILPGPAPGKWGVFVCGECAQKADGDFEGFWKKHLA